MSRLSFLKILLHLNLVQYGKIYYLSPSYLLVAGEITWIEHRAHVLENLQKEAIRKAARKMNLIVNMYENPSSWLLIEMAKIWVWDKVYKLKRKIWIG